MTFDIETPLPGQKLLPQCDSSLRYHAILITQIFSRSINYTRVV